MHQRAFPPSPRAAAWALVAWQIFWPTWYELAQADDILFNAQQGQDYGAALLEQGLPLPSIRTDNPTVEQSTDDAQFYIREFMPGSGIDSQALSDLMSIYDQPETMQAEALQGLANTSETGCSETWFQYVESRAVLRVTALERRLEPRLDATGQPVLDATGDPVYDIIDMAKPVEGTLDIAHPALGAANQKEVEVRKAKPGAPGYVLVYWIEPFAAPSDTSYVVYNHRLGPGAAGSILSYGRPASGWIPKGSVTATGVNTEVRIDADLWQVNRRYYTPPDTGCPPDPATCIADGLNFCAEPGLGILDVFVHGKRSGSQAYMDIRSGALIEGATTYELAPILNASVPTLGGYASDFGTLFSGCTELTSVDFGTKTVHQEDIKTCYNVRTHLGDEGCDGYRGTHFAQVSRQTTLTATAFRQIQDPLIDPATGEQVIDPDGNPVYVTHTEPSTYTGPVNLSYPTIGAGGEWDTEPDADGYFLHYRHQPFFASSSDHFTVDHQAVSDGAVSGSATSYGQPADGWTTQGSFSVSGATRVELQATLYLVVDNQIYGCDRYIQYLADGFCQGEIVCTEDRAPCTTLDGVTFCESGHPASGILELLPAWGTDDSQSNNYHTGGGPLPAGPGKMCWRGHGTPMSCHFTAGDLDCYTDAQGDTQCGQTAGIGTDQHFGDPNYADDCALKGLFGNGECRYVGQVCTEGGLGLFSGVCYVYTVRYDCGADYTYESPVSASFSQLCSAGIRCLGTECHNPETETNTDFGRAISAAQAIEFMQTDMVCLETGLAPTSTSDSCTLSVFPGKHRDCKIPVGSSIGLTPNCCDEGDAAAAGIDIISYLLLIYYGNKLAQQPAVAAALAKIPGYGGLVEAFETMTSPLSGAITSTTELFSSAASDFMRALGYKSSTYGMCTASYGAASDIGGMISEVESMFAKGIYDFLVKADMKMLADQLFVNEGGKWILNTASELGQIIAYIQIAFLVYTVLKILGHLIFKCTEGELTLGVDKKVGNCTYVGDYCKEKVLVVCVETRRSYCCYTSPLARIIAEQLRAQGVGGGWGSPRSPNCRGFTPAELAQADWSQVDLSEWEWRLIEAGLLPDSTPQAEATWGESSSRATRETSEIAQGPDGEIPYADYLRERLQDKVDDIEVRREALAKEPVCYSDPSLMPWYMDREVTPEEILVLSGAGGSGSTASCGEGCLYLYLGQVGDNYWSGNCAIHESNVSLDIKRPDLITSATLEFAKWDDYMQVWIGGSLIWSGPNSNFPPETAGACELGTSWETAPNQDVTSFFKAKGQVDTRIRVSVTGLGEGYARVKLLYQSGTSGGSAGDCLTFP